MNKNNDQPPVSCSSISALAGMCGGFIAVLLGLAVKLGIKPAS